MVNFGTGRSQICDDEKSQNALFFDKSGLFSNLAKSGELYAFSEV